ncbi:hypothetical protein [Kitasatospora sp. NPDC056531]|uniref:hypothetical protein n=1 Tax=Kitasatospora sp. NPDC056531 TaxID=3345856 RepID=UPI0036A9215A
MGSRVPEDRPGVLRLLESFQGILYSPAAGRVAIERPDPENENAGDQTGIHHRSGCTQ